MNDAEDSVPLEERMARLGIFEEDLQEKFVLGSGPGGQNINKTANCVFLKHLPSGTHVKCQETRSRAANRIRARELLCDSIESGARAGESEEIQTREKARRRNRKPSARAKRRNLETKRRRSEVKRRRGKPGDGD
ncbi:MAG: peptide chain release factor-like protein [Verrucomicrobia bacterium]|nr:peptide chain release factor-like protein [Verrucomicrobiota bacterium]